MCVSIFSTSFVTFLVLRRTERDVIKNVHWSSCGVSNFNDTLIFSSFEKYANIKFRENPDSGSRVVPCVRTDRQTDMTTLTVAFRNFANAPKKAARKCSGISPRQSTTPPWSAPSQPIWFPTFVKLYTVSWKQRQLEGTGNVCTYVTWRRSQLQHTWTPRGVRRFVNHRTALPTTTRGVHLTNRHHSGTQLTCNREQNRLLILVSLYRGYKNESHG